MKDILDALERLFGSRVLVAALMLLLLYFVAQSVLKLLATLREKNSLQSQLSTLKTHYEVLKIARDIEVLKREHQLQDDPQEMELAAELKRLTGAHLLPDPAAAATIALEAEISELSTRHRWLGYLFYLTAQLGIRLWGMGLLAYAVISAIFGDDSTKEGANWDNIIIVSALILCGFWLSSTVVRATSRAGISDRIRYWSYVVGFAIATFLVWLWSVT